MMIPGQTEFLEGIAQYEKRDAMYKVATFLVRHFWGNPSDMADGLGVLLLTWNQACYRYGSFDFDKLEECIAKNLAILQAFRQRNIASLSESDEEMMRKLFNEFVDALRVASGKGRGRKSPVAAAKALHLLAPEFFPLWDKGIAKAYACRCDINYSEKYILFSKKIKQIAAVVETYVQSANRPVLKRIDEYNYSKFTKSWI